MTSEALESLLLDQLGFCGCGCPEDALTFLHEVLGAYAHKDTIEGPQDPKWRPAWDAIAAVLARRAPQNSSCSTS
jgi:tetrahydromethanopterin S-methyltransferase subunit D